MSETGKVLIHGKEYKTVALRVAEFREDHPSWGIIPELISRDDDVVIIRAIIEDEEGRTIGCGHAEEVRGSTQINRTSALENCETSAIGRALAACGYAGTEYASANEVENAVHQQNQPKKRINKQAMQKSVAAILDCLEADDGLGMRETIGELSQHEQEFIWPQFDTKQKAAIKKMLYEENQNG